jgi:hypothetical protein
VSAYDQAVGSGIFFVAICGAALTVGLKHGSLAPYVPAVDRLKAPTRFWTVMLVCGGIVVLNVVNLARGLNGS